MDEFVVNICKQHYVEPWAQNSINSDWVRYFCKCSPGRGFHYSCIADCKFYVITLKVKQEFHIFSLNAEHNHILGLKLIPLSQMIRQEIICFHPVGL